MKPEQPATLDDVVVQLRRIRRDLKEFMSVLELLTKHAEIVNLFMNTSMKRLKPQPAEDEKPTTVH